jgi:hypothetical protein
MSTTFLKSHMYISVVNVNKTLCGWSRPVTEQPGTAPPYGPPCPSAGYWILPDLVADAQWRHLEVEPNCRTRSVLFLSSPEFCRFFFLTLRHCSRLNAVAIRDNNNDVFGTVTGYGSDTAWWVPNMGRFLVSKYGVPPHWGSVLQLSPSDVNRQQN